jgi:hypothetical protein
MWQRWNQTSHIFEKSVDNGASWTPLPLSASIITEGTIPIARQWPTTAYTDVSNVFTLNNTFNQSIFTNANPLDVGNWAYWTPTITGAGFVLGNGSFFARYAKIFKLVFLTMRFALGSTSAAGNGQWRISLPTGEGLNPYLGMSTPPILNGIAYDSSAAQNFQVTASLAGPAELICQDVSGNYIPTSGFPFVWAANDYIALNGFYESTA